MSMVKNEAILYTVKAALLSWGRRFIITDSNGVEVLKIQEKLFRFQPTFEFYQNNERIYTLKKKWFHLRPTYAFEGIDLTISGSIWLHQYQFEKDADIVAEVSKKWLSWGDVYYLDVKDESLAMPIIGAVIMIDCVLASQAAAHHSSSN